MARTPKAPCKISGEGFEKMVIRVRQDPNLALLNLEELITAEGA